MARAPRSIRVEAVVLRHSDWGEADRLLVLYSQQHGKIRAVARGARRLISRKAGHLEPFTCVDLLLSRGRDMWTVAQAETVDAFLELKEDLSRIGYASYVVELLDRFTYDESNNPALYRLLVETLKRISLDDEIFPQTAYFQVRLLDLMGFRPQLINCVQCGEEIMPQNQFISPALGGVVCPKCGQRGAQASRPVSVEALRYLRHFQRSSNQRAMQAKIPKNVQAEMEKLLQDYMTYQLERRLNSQSFLDELRR